MFKSNCFYVLCYIMNPDVWGPPFWFTLHTISMTYPLHPNNVTKKKYYELVTNLPLFLPHHKIGNHFAALLDEYPIQPYLSSRLSFMKWVHFMHNKINSYLGKKELSLYDFIDSYNKMYEPKDITDKKKNMLKKRYIEISIIGALVLIVFYCYKK